MKCLHCEGPAIGQWILTFNQEKLDPCCQDHKNNVAQQIQNGRFLRGVAIFEYFATETVHS